MHFRSMNSQATWLHTNEQLGMVWSRQQQDGQIEKVVMSCAYHGKGYIARAIGAQSYQSHLNSDKNAAKLELMALLEHDGWMHIGADEQLSNKPSVATIFGFKKMTTG